MDKLPVILNKDEIKALLAQAGRRSTTGIRNRALLEVMYRAGLRVSEACGLRCLDYKADNELLEVRAGKNGKDRVLPLDSRAVAWLEKWIERRARAGLVGGWLFCTLQGRPVSSRYVQQMVKRYARKAGLADLDRVTPHKLRHAFATELLEEGFTIRQVQELLGHASLVTTQIYTHVRPAELQARIKARAAG